MAIYLLVKEHRDTGLKYLCKHEDFSLDGCEKYKGSGTYWKRHLKQHGNSVETKCLFVTEDKEEFSKIALQYSIEFDIVNSKEWANLTNEQGEGGNVFGPEFYRESSKQMWSNAEFKNKQMNRLLEHIKVIQLLAAKAAKEKLTGVLKSEQHKNNMRGKRPHVNQSCSKNNNAKKITTPFGEFDSIREASLKIPEHSYRMIWDRLQNNNEWRYQNY